MSGMRSQRGICIGGTSRSYLHARSIAFLITSDRGQGSRVAVFHRWASASRTADPIHVRASAVPGSRPYIKPRRRHVELLRLRESLQLQRRLRAPARRATRPRARTSIPRIVEVSPPHVNLTLATSSPRACSVSPIATRSRLQAAVDRRRNAVTPP